MNNPGEISSIIKSQIENYKSRVEMTETGKVILVGDGIARVYGLSNCMANELLEFEDGSFGMAQNLEEETVSAVLLSDTSNIKEILLESSFETPWCPSHSIIVKWSERYKDIELELVNKYYEPGCAFAGKMGFNNEEGFYDEYRINPYSGRCKRYLWR